MNINSYFNSGSLKKRDLSKQSNDGEDCKKPRVGSLNYSLGLNSTALVGAYSS